MKERYVNVPGFTDREHFTADMEEALSDTELVGIIRTLEEVGEDPKLEGFKELVDRIATLCDEHHLSTDEMGVVLSHARRALVSQQSEREL